VKDWLGTEIRAGDHVVYPGYGGSSLWMTLAEVIQLHPGTGDEVEYWERIPDKLTVQLIRQTYNEDPNPRLTKINTKRVVVVRHKEEEHV
jgi:hypothetical protein